MTVSEKEALELERCVQENGYAVAVYEAIGGYTVGLKDYELPDLVILTPRNEDGDFNHPGLVLERILELLRDQHLILDKGGVIEIPASLHEFWSEGDFDTTVSLVPLDPECVSVLPHLNTQQWMNTWLYQVVFSDEPERFTPQSTDFLEV